MIKQIALLWLFIFISCQLCLAHSGGHFHKNDGTVFSNWHLKTGATIRGNFSYSKADVIFLELENGKLLEVPINTLTTEDEALAKLKIEKINAIQLQLTEAKLATKKVTSILPYLLFLLFLVLTIGCTVLAFTAIKIYQKSQYSRRLLHKLSYLLPLLLFSVYACKKSAESISLELIPKSSVGFIDSAFAPFKPAVATKWDDTYFYVSSNGIPAHNMMVGITNWQQQVPIPQFYTGTNSWSIPLQPVYATTPLSTKYNLMKGAVAIAANGIPIFNALNNRGEDSYLIGELDNWGGHCGKGDDYHYHAAPMHLGTANNLPIAFALDGFAVYGAKEPDGTSMLALDTCHGHKVSNGVYHYHGTTNYPYVIGAMKGKVTLDPNTAAPENQILPQAFSSPLRPATSPLNGASITAYAATGVNAFKLTYKRGIKFGYVDYSWNTSNKYTFILTDTAGVAVTTVYQR